MPNFFKEIRKFIYYIFSNLKWNGYNCNCDIFNCYCEVDGLKTKSICFLLLII